jgi:hypothetical protein
MVLRRVLVLFALIAGGLLVTPAAPAWACSCAARSEAEHREDADTVFVGVATTVIGPSDPFFSGAAVAVEFTVESVTKGVVADRTRVSTVASEASCGYEFEAGRRYLVFARAGSTGLCSGTGELPPRTTGVVPGASTPAIAAQPLPTPVPLAPDRAVWWSVGAILLTVAVGAVIIRRKAG